MAQPGQNEPAGQDEQPGKPWDYTLRKYLLLLATLVATVTYSAGFNPPGGVWQDTTASHLAGDPIIRDIRYVRYTVFFYCNASAFVSSLVVVVLILLHAVLHEKDYGWIKLLPLRVAMVLDLLSLMMAYAAGTCRDTFTKLYSSLLVASVFLYLLLQMMFATLSSDQQDNNNNSGSRSDTGTGTGPGSGPISSTGTGSDSNLPIERHRKVLMLLATFAVSVTYVAGLNTPGGFWDNAEGGHRPGDAILKEHHEARLTAFFVCNTTAFVASLLTIVLLVDRNLLKWATVWTCELYGCIIVALIGLVGAYAAGSSREIATTTYVLSLVGAVLLCILLQVTILEHCNWPSCCSSQYWADLIPSRFRRQHNDSEEQAADKARSLVLLLATLAATITYQAGLDPPGGVWQENGNGHIAGDPILFTTNPRRYKAFFYCNSVAFVASLVVIVLVQKKLQLGHHVLEVAMILDLFGLIGAYAAGTCRNVSTSIYVMAMVGVVLVYVVVHVIFFTLDHHNDNGSTPKDNELVEKRRKRLLLFAILTATITYQAGLTPPSGFLLRDDNSTGHRAGDPVLLYNSTKRYTAFFYCNSASFMLSMALIILLVNPNLYRPAIRSCALSVCTAAGLFGLLGAYAAGSTQHLRTSISIFVLVSVVLLVLVLLLLVFCVKELRNKNKITADADATAAADADADADTTAAATAATAATATTPPAATVATAATAAATPGMAAGNESSSQGRREGETEAQKRKKRHAKRKYLMLLGILVASVTYQAGLDQPGGVWQHTGDGHDAGNPVMHDNRRRRYHAFFYCNSTAFVASIVVIILLLPHSLHKEDWWFRVMNTTILLDLLALLGAYSTGSSRDRKTSAYVAALIAAVLAYVAVHVMLSLLCSQKRPQPEPPTEVPSSV